MKPNIFWFGVFFWLFTNPSTNLPAVPPWVQRIWSLNKLPGDTSLISSEEIIMPFRNQFILRQKCIAAIILNMGWSPCKITEPDFSITFFQWSMRELTVLSSLHKRLRVRLTYLFHWLLIKTCLTCRGRSLLPDSYSLEKTSLGNQCPAFSTHT